MADFVMTTKKKAASVDPATMIHLSSKISKAIEQKTMTIDCRGHWGNGRYNPAERFRSEMFFPVCSLADAKKLDGALKRKGKVREFITIAEASCLTACPVCAEHLALETNGKVLRTTTTCKMPDGMTVEFELNVPSGKIVCRDDLRSWFDVYGDFNINTRKGTILNIQAMAEIGCAHGYVGNSCPGVYRLLKGSYIIANGAYKNGSYDDKDYIAPEGEQVASICTDLWWYSLVDYDEFMRRAQITPKDAGAETFEVEPGVYRFRHFYGCDLNRNDDERDGKPYTYAEFEWVREPDPVTDYLVEVDARNFTIHQVIHRSLKNYPDLYANNPEGIRGAIDHMFCVIGGGGEWHPNGFIQYDPAMTADEPEIRSIPKFNTPQRWYGLSGYSALCAAAGVVVDDYSKSEIEKLNPSFLKVAFDVARNIHLFGTNNDHRKDSEQQEIALKCLKGLAERYPDDIPKDCKILLMPVIDQANWVLELLKTPVTFYWHTTKGGKKILRLKNKYHDAPAMLSGCYLTEYEPRPGEIERHEIKNYGKFMSYKHGQSREAMYWASLIGQFVLWIKEKEHVATDAPAVPYRTSGGTFIRHRCAHAKVQDGFKERLAQTSYNVNTIVLPGEKEEIDSKKKTGGH